VRHWPRRVWQARSSRRISEPRNASSALLTLSIGAERFSLRAMTLV
jgi:hypothetical protein